MIPVDVFGMQPEMKLLGNSCGYTSLLSRGRAVFEVRQFDAIIVMRVVATKRYVIYIRYRYVRYSLGRGWRRVIDHE